MSYYILNFLRDEDAARDLGRAITNTVRLKHIESLWEVLDDITLLGVDAFAKTSRKYKKSLSSDQTSSLRSYLSGLTEAQRDAIRSISKNAVKRMSEEEQMSSTISIFEILGYSEVYRDEDLYAVDWFEDFPKDIPYGCVVEAYKVMEEF